MTIHFQISSNFKSIPFYWKNGTKYYGRNNTGHFAKAHLECFWKRMRPFTTHVAIYWWRKKHISIAIGGIKILQSQSKTNDPWVEWFYRWGCTWSLKPIMLQLSSYRSLLCLDVDVEEILSIISCLKWLAFANVLRSKLCHLDYDVSSRKIV